MFGRNSPLLCGRTWEHEWLKDRQEPIALPSPYSRTVNRGTAMLSNNGSCLVEMAHHCVAVTGNMSGWKTERQTRFNDGSMCCRNVAAALTQWGKCKQYWADNVWMVDSGQMVQLHSHGVANVNNIGEINGGLVDWLILAKCCVCTHTVGKM